MDCRVNFSAQGNNEDRTALRCIQSHLSSIRIANALTVT